MPIRNEGRCASPGRSKKTSGMHCCIPAFLSSMVLERLTSSSSWLLSFSLPFYSPLDLFEFSRQQSWRSAFQYSSIEIVFSLVKRKVSARTENRGPKPERRTESRARSSRVGVEISESEPMQASFSDQSLKI
jgi:hypothetical protein